MRRSTTVPRYIVQTVSQLTSSRQRVHPTTSYAEVAPAGVNGFNQSESTELTCCVCLFLLPSPAHLKLNGGGGLASKLASSIDRHHPR